MAGGRLNYRLPMGIAARRTALVAGFCMRGTMAGCGANSRKHFLILRMSMKSNRRSTSATAVIGFMLVAFIVFLATQSIPVGIVAGAVVAVVLTRKRH